MPSAELAGDRVVIRTEYRDRHLVKQLPGAHYDSTEYTWSAPLSWSTCVTLRGLFGERLEVGPQLADWSWREFRTRVSPANQLRDRLEPLAHDEADDDLRPFQRAGVEFLMNAKQALLADPMGSGKTVQVIRALRRLSAGRGGSAFPVLIVCPNSVKAVWHDEFDKWLPHTAVSVAGGNVTQRRRAIAEVAEGRADVLVINWEALRLHTKLAGFGDQRLTDAEKQHKDLNAIRWATVVCDEAHRMKDPRAKQTRAAWGVSGLADYRFALTGTPIANTPADLWSLLHFLDPDEWPAKTKYVDRWCEAAFNQFGGLQILGLRADTRDEFFTIVNPRVRRLPKELLLPQLPPKVYQTRHVEMSAKQDKAYTSMEERLGALLDDGSLLIAPNALAQLTRLSQFAAAYATLDEADKVHLAEPSSKVDALVDLLDELDPAESVVVFAVSKQLVNLASARLTKLNVSHELITGDQPPTARADTVERFQEGKLRAVLCTVAAGGVGLTLTRARHVVFLQRSWSPVDDQQAEDRVHRIGSEVHDSVEVIDLVTSGTVEDRVRQVLAEKGERLEEIVRDQETLARLIRGGTK